jgi:SulP family sulfate permease
MVFVVAFSSCLDVAAVQIELGRQLDFNHELKTVGWSNILSGLTGGFSGSYIFSQTIFTMRTGGGKSTKAVGLVVVAAELVLCTHESFIIPIYLYYLSGSHSCDTEMWQVIPW